MKLTTNHIPGSMPDIIFVSLEDWDEIWRRNQFFCAGLAARFPGMKLLFVGLPRNVSYLLRQGRLADLRGSNTWTAPERPNITVTRPLKLLPNSFSWGRRFNDFLFRRHVRRAAAALGIATPILWLNAHSAVHMLRTMNEQAVIYDITDDWTTLTQPEAVTQLIKLQDAELCRRADAVIVCSEQLLALKQGMSSNLRLVPNGVDADHYRAVLDDKGPLPSGPASWPKPVLGYTGTIHPDRVDVPLVEAVARGLTSGSIVLIGPNFLSPEDQARLLETGRVIFHGTAPYDSLPGFMRAFDVCITPHRMTPFTESLNPIKLWEYLAAGKPIVSTDIAGFRDYPQFVHLAHDSNSFLKAVEEALHQDLAVGEASRREAQRHSWNSRLDDIVTILHSSIGRAKKTANV